MRPGVIYCRQSNQIAASPSEAVCMEIDMFESDLMFKLIDSGTNTKSWHVRLAGRLGSVEG